MAKSYWKISTSIIEEGKEVSEHDAIADLEQLARDQIAKYIIRKYKGHGMARLINKRKAI